MPKINAESVELWAGEVFAYCREHRNSLDSERHRQFVKKSCQSMMQESLDCSLALEEELKAVKRELQASKKRIKSLQEMLYETEAL